MSFPLPTDRWQRLADQAPVRPRLVLHAGGPPLGSVDPALAEALLDAGLPLRRDGQALRLLDPLDASLAQVARWLHGQGLTGRWRDELLAVRDEAGQRHGCIERAAVRPLGITTQAVHLVGRSADGGFWLQQRALDKATDPGLWDTLMGGLVSDGESIATTLERETWEEAGLRPGQWRDLRPLGRVTVRRPLPEGYMVEWIEAFEATLVDGASPVNQDGEVQRFDRVSATELAQRLADGVFTLEAALVLQKALRGGSG